MNLLVVSPHRGDAAFSLAFAIDGWRKAGHRVTILSVFTRSRHAPFSDVDTLHENDQMSYASAMRRREDEAFLRQMPGLTMLDLNGKDAPIRLRCEESEVRTAEVRADDKMLGKIQRAIAEIAASPRGLQGLVLPLGLGGHVDHRTVRQGATPEDATMPCACYEELPEAAEPGAEAEVAARAAAWPSGPLAPVFGPSLQTAAWKRRMALLYGSQIDAATADTIAGFAERYGGRERLWANAAWLAQGGRLASLV